MQENPNHLKDLLYKLTKSAVCFCAVPDSPPYIYIYTLELVYGCRWDYSLRSMTEIRFVRNRKHRYRPPDQLWSQNLYSLNSLNFQCTFSILTQKKREFFFFIHGSFSLIWVIFKRTLTTLRTSTAIISFLGVSSVIFSSPRNVFYVWDGNKEYNMKCARTVRFLIQLKTLFSLSISPLSLCTGSRSCLSQIYFIRTKSLLSGR